MGLKNLLDQILGVGGGGLLRPLAVWIEIPDIRASVAIIIVHYFVRLSSMTSDSHLF